jgi:hypothetical protein
MDATVDMAEAGHNAPETKSLRAARRAREARIRFWRAFLVSTFFVIIIGANLFVGAVVMIGNMRGQSIFEKPAPLARTAQIRRPLLDGTFCRNIVFDNNTSLSVEDKIERCEQPAARKALLPVVKSKTQFSWGGR